MFSFINPHCRYGSLLQLVVIDHRDVRRCWYTQTMEKNFRSQQVRLFDSRKLAEATRHEIRANAEQVAADNGLKIEFIHNLKWFPRKSVLMTSLRKAVKHRGQVSNGML